MLNTIIVHIKDIDARGYSYDIIIKVLILETLKTAYNTIIIPVHEPLFYDLNHKKLAIEYYECRRVSSMNQYAL